MIDYKKYAIKRDKLDLESSLKGLDDKILKKYMDDNEIDNIHEVKEYIIDSFSMILDMSKNDMFTRLFFQKLLNNENSYIMSAYESDIESLWVYVYEKNGYYSYYIPTEIKKIIKKELNIK